MILHCWKLFFRSFLFIAAASIYIMNKVNNTGSLFGGYENKLLILGIIWCIFFTEILLRFRR